MEASVSTADLRTRLAQLSADERQRLAARLNGVTLGSEFPGTSTPVSYQQRNFWILHQMAERPETYNSAHVLRLSGRLDADALRRALLAVSHDYQIYRTVYLEAAGDIKSVVRDDLSPDFEFVDLEDSARAGEDDVLSAVSEIRNRPFMLDRESPLRARLYRLDAECHFLGLIFHHIANDGGSLNLFWNAVRNAYDAIERGGHVAQPDADLQYESFARRQANRTSNDDLGEALAYWVKQLKGSPNAAGFMYDYPAATGPEQSESEVVLPIGAMEERVGALARAEGTTRNVVYLAAYYAWLHRETGSEDAVVGVPITSRMRWEDKEVLGCCINMLSVRARLRPAWTFRDLVRETRRVMLDGIRHSDMPFLRLVEELGRTSNGTFGFYNTTFQYRNFIETFDSIGGCKVDCLFVPRRTSQFPVMLEIFPLHGVPRASLVYDTTLFRRETAEGMLRRYCTLVEAALAEPDGPLEDLACLDDDERRLVVEVWARNRTTYPVGATVPDLFAQQVAMCPNAPALVSEGHSMTYAELDRASSAVAAGLRRRGLTAGAHVGICIDRSFDLIVGLLGILKCGAAYVPLDPEYPPARLKFMVDDARLWGVLVDEANLPRIRNLGSSAFLVQALNGSHVSESKLTSVSASSPAYLMYTSGSTGNPKGVLIPHRGIVRLVRGADYADLNAGETFLQLSSPSFDAATFEIWAPLLNGGRLVLMPPGTPSVRDIGDVLQKYGVTTLWLTAGLFHAIVDEDPGVLSPLRQLLAGGDVLSPDHVLRCLNACPSLRLINGYGPTENTTFSCCYPIPRDTEFAARIPIGRPIANSEAYVLDKRLRPVPIGIVGELVVGGEGVGLGYWNRPELTRERFVRHPFANGTEARLYRTGDRARFLPDGTIEFLGRQDHQVKIRGFRVELSEIETAIMRAPGVRQCLVIAHMEKTTGLVAYVVHDRRDRGVVDTLREVARESLPNYMMPAHWVLLEKLPLTANGKVDRHALPAPERSAAGNSKPPANQLEWRLLEIVQRLFQTDAIGCEDDIFEAGGNSLLAIRFIAEIERLTGQPLGISRLFQHPTIRSLARVMMEDSTTPKWTSLVPLAPEGLGPPLFVAHGIRGELFALKKFGRQLGGDHPVFGLQAVEHSGAGQRHTSIESMAEHYVSEIRSLQPDGPYYLLGFSLGGMIAFEVASQLRRAGHEVGMLFLLDAHPQNIPALVRLRMMMPYWRRRLRHHIGLVARSEDRLSYLKARIRTIRGQFGATRGAEGKMNEDAVVVPPQADYYQAIARHYVPRPVDLPVTLVQAEKNSRNLRAAWTYLSRRVPAVRRLPGGHLDLLSGRSLQMLVELVHERLEIARRQDT